MKKLKVYQKEMIKEVVITALFWLGGVILMWGVLDALGVSIL